MIALRERLSTLFGEVSPESTLPLNADTASVTTTAVDEPARFDERKMEWKSEKLQAESEGISRRTLLKYGGGAADGAGLLGGGWLFYDTVLRKRTPEETVRKCYTALNNGDRERANELVHEDSPAEYGPGVARRWEQKDIEIAEVELISKSENRAKARLVVSGASSQRDQQETTLQLRTEDGEWKIWLG